MIFLNSVIELQDEQAVVEKPLFTASPRKKKAELGKEGEIN